MPLVVVCGRPLGGKTVRSYALAACLRERGHRVVVVSDSALRTGPLGVDETHRHQLRAAVERVLAEPSVVCVCDAANEVRGFRYELHCLSKARATPICTLYCDVAPLVADRRNAAAPPTRRADAETLVFHRRRFEPPSDANRWERPLFVCADSEPDPPSAAAAVSAFADALDAAARDAKDGVPCPAPVRDALRLPLDALCAALFEAAAPTPNSATHEAPVATTVLVRGLDLATSAVVAALLKAVNDVAFVPGDEVSLLPATERRIVVARKVGAAELGRLRRQFVRINEACAATLPDPEDAFATFLQTALS